MGVCVYAGFETKLAKNMREAPIKFSQLDRIATRAVIVILCFQFALSLASAVGMSGFEKANDKDLWYTGLKSSISHSVVDGEVGRPRAAGPAGSGLWVPDVCHRVSASSCPCRCT